MREVLHLEKKEAFEFKSARIDLVAFQPATSDLTAIAALLEKKLGSNTHFFNQEALLIDLIQIQDHTLDLAGLLMLMQQFNLFPIAIRHANIAQQEIAIAHQLAILSDEKAKPEPKIEKTYLPSLIITRPVRTGQQIYAKNRDLVVLNLVSAGAELIADGSIHVYAPLRGRALAGISGNTEARIFTACMEAELLSIAGVYRTLEEKLPDSLYEKSVQVFLDKKKLVIEALQF
jgi:septum site-determining protein MinC